MDHLFIYSIIGGVALVFLFVAARIAVRWAVRLAIAGFLIVTLGGAAWWWLTKPPNQPESKPRPSAAKSPSSNRR